MWLSLNTQDDSVYSRPYRIIPRPVGTLKAQKKGILKFAKITRETTQNAYFEQRVVTHTVPQKGQKRPALNSTKDCAKKIPLFF